MSRRVKPAAALTGRPFLLPLFLDFKELAGYARSGNAGLADENLGRHPGGIAQLARAVALQAIGQGFESPYLQRRYISWTRR